MKYSRPSQALRDSFVKLIEWSANGYPTWVDYRSLIRCRLIVLIKFQGVGPIGIEDVFRTLVSAFLAITGKVVKRICGTDQLCNGFKASIEGGVHCVRSLWSIFWIMKIRGEYY